MNNELIISQVSQTLEIPVQQIKSKSRKRVLLDARGICVLLIKKYVKDQSLEEIGQSLGGKDHATIINATRTYENLIESNKAFNFQYQQCKDALWNYLSVTFNNIPQF